MDRIGVRCRGIKTPVRKGVRRFTLCHHTNPIIEIIYNYKNFERGEIIVKKVRQIISVFFSGAAFFGSHHFLFPLAEEISHPFRDFGISIPFIVEGG